MPVLLKHIAYLQQVIEKQNNLFQRALHNICLYQRLGGVALLETLLLGLRLQIELISGLPGGSHLPFMKIQSLNVLAAVL